MIYTDLMEFKSIFLLGLTEPEENSLRLFFSRSKSVPEPFSIGDKVYENAQSIEIDEDLPVIQVDFETYIGYSILNESYTSWDDYQKFEGKSFRFYSRSRYLDFIKVGTFATEDYPGSFAHYGMVCLNHIVDIVSISNPTIKEVHRNP